MTRFRSLLPWGRVSKVHLHEANERYITLSRLVDQYRKRYESTGHRDEGQLELLKSCDEILENIQKHYLRRQEELINFAWRELIRVQVMILDNLITSSEPEKLMHQIDAAREEAFRLSVLELPPVKERLERLAEELDERSTDEFKVVRIKRILRALHERFNSIRSTRMHQQYVNVWVYKFAVLALVIISILLIDNAGPILRETDSEVATPQYGIVDSLPARAGLLPDPAAADFGAWLLVFLDAPLDFFRTLFEYNVLAFVYLAGLTGGFFSVANRVRGQTLTPGDDAYTGWYVLTKPLVGALGAVIIYILLESGFTDLNPLPSDAQEGDLTKAKIFGIAFVSGFSERFVFPNFR